MHHTRYMHALHTNTFLYMYTTYTHSYTRVQLHSYTCTPPTCTHIPTHVYNYIPTHDYTIHTQTHDTTHSMHMYYTPTHIHNSHITFAYIYQHTYTNIHRPIHCENNVLLHYSLLFDWMEHVSIRIACLTTCTSVYCPSISAPMNSSSAPTAS